MKSITNDSLQSLEIYIKAPQGSTPYWLKPKETIVISEHALTTQLVNLSRRNMIKIKNI